MEKQKVILAVFLAFVMFALLPTSQVIAGPKPPSPDPVLQKLDQVLQKLDQIQTQQNQSQEQVNQIQNKLDNIPPIWSKQLPGAERFVAIMNEGGAILDKETGLIWDKYVPFTPYSTGDFKTAQAICYTVGIAGRYGWRLPTVEELFSLVDLSGPGNLPPNHPFVITDPTATFWTSTTINLSNADGLGMAISFNPVGCYYDSKATIHQVWCVRGGHGYDGLK